MDGCFSTVEVQCYHNSHSAPLVRTTDVHNEPPGWRNSYPTHENKPVVKCVAEFQSQVARHREAHTLVARQLTVPDSERLARKKKRRRRRWERQQRAAAQQPVRFLEGYAAVPYPVAMLAPSFASKTGTDSYDDDEDYILDEDSSSGTHPHALQLCCCYAALGAAVLCRAVLCRFCYLQCCAVRAVRAGLWCATLCCGAVLCCGALCCALICCVGLCCAELH